MITRWIVRIWRAVVAVGVSSACSAAPMAVTHAQRPNAGGNAIGNELSFETLATLVRAFHPIALNARATVDAARAEERVALGGFDPVVSGSLDHKKFDGTSYYSYGAVKLTAPTPLGVDVQLGFERAMGKYLNPERQVPSPGLFSAGFRIPLGQRIITDERRTGIAVARAAVSAAEADSASAVNKLLAQVAKDYATWFETARLDSLVAGSVVLAEQRLDAVRLRVQLGEAPAIDTVESRLELTRRLVLKADTERNRTNARLQLETHLWQSNRAKSELADVVTPSRDIVPAGWASVLDSTTSGMIPSAMVRAHPDVRKARAREVQQSANRRLVLQGLLPNASAEWFALAKDADSFTGPGGESAKMSATVSQSLLMIRERNRVGAAGYRVSQAIADIARIERDVVAGIGMAEADLRATNSMMQLQQQALDLSRALQSGEQRRFEAGESTVFLINARDRSVLEEAMKLVSLQSKLFVAIIMLQTARGVVN